MYKNSKELIDQAVALEKLLYIHNIIRLGEGVYQDILSMQEYTSKYYKTTLPRIRTATIYTQFENNFLAKEFPFDCKQLKVNNFGDYRPEISNDNIILHLARAKDKGCLPKSARYMKNKARLNDFPAKQGTLLTKEFPNVGLEKYYGIITYGGEDSLEFINLVIPDAEFKEVLEVKDLTYIDRLFINKKVETEQEIRKRRMQLKEEVIKKIHAEGV